MKKTSQKPASEAEVNMTPMLDIVFIMLIFFIVCSSFVRESGLDVIQHQSDDDIDTKPSDAKTVIVKICGNHDILIDQRAIDVRSIRANIERKLAEDSSTVVIIQSEQDAPTGRLITALNQARAAKARVSVSPEATHCESDKLDS